MVDLAILYAAPKVLIAPGHQWVQRINPDEVLWASPIEIDGVAVEGFRFRISAMMSMPEEAVTCQLEYHERRKIGGPLCRIDWRPIHTHDNKANGPPELRHKRFTGTHHHEFNLNWMYLAAQVRRGRIPIAKEIEKEPQNFAELLAFLEKELRIVNPGMVPRPPWQETLF